MTGKQEKEMKKALIDHFREKGIITDEVNRLINCANFDLYYGPYETGFEPDGDGWKYPGFTESVRKISAALGDVRELWFDSDWNGVLEREPEGEEIDGEYIEPFWESIYHLERKDVLRALVGKELVSYL